MVGGSQGGMRTQRQSGTARRPAARGRRSRWALPLTLTLVWVLASSAQAFPTRDACTAPRQPARARCLAVQLLVEGTTTAQSLAAARTRRSAVPDSRPESGFQTPQRLRELYGLPEETAAGSTQTIAVVDAFDDPTAESDLAVYSKQFGLPPCTSENGCFTRAGPARSRSTCRWPTRSARPATSCSSRREPKNSATSRRG
jgi:hypothetical protein